jgi:pimeloyl-ACP methyl ester carboxylesterase
MSTTANGLEGGRLVRLSDAELHVYEHGPAGGRPLVLLHGFLTSAYAWRHVYPKLAREHRVVLVDLPGSGRSPDPRRGRWSADRAADLLEGLLDALDLPTATLVGSQMGGSLVAWFAARRRGRVDRMVVMAAGVLGEATTNLGLYRLLANPLVGPQLARRFPQGKFEERWKAAHGPAHDHEPEAVAYYFEQLRRRGHAMARLGLGVRQSYGEWFDRLAGPIEGLDVPTLLIFGEDDRLVPPSTGRRFEELLADARLVLLPGCGDFPQEERPDEVVEAVLPFVSEPA